MTIKLEGTAEMARKLNSIATGLNPVFGAALLPAGKLLEKRSRDNTPVDEGDLRDSHETVGPVIQGNTVSVKVQAGGQQAPHGIDVHEDVSAGHDDGESKFMEKAAKETKGALLAGLAFRGTVRRWR